MALVHVEAARQYNSADYYLMEAFEFVPRRSIHRVPSPDITRRAVI
jgi:hypothetical protein